MKKILTLCAAVMLVATTIQAQHEIGVVAGGLNGASYKYWFSNNFAVQADLAVGLSRVYLGEYFKGNKYYEGGYSLYDFTINPNALYHFELPENFKIYAGGGMSFGLVSPISNTNPKGIMGKFGLNAACGVSYDLDGVPLVLALDFRPGYGLGFYDANTTHVSFFDWKLGFAVRYKL